MNLFKFAYNSIIIVYIYVKIVYVLQVYGLEQFFIITL